MSNYVSSALFVHTHETAALVDKLQRHESEPAIRAIVVDALLEDAHNILVDVDHVVVAGTLETIKTVLKLSATYHFSVGIVPNENQKNLSRFYDLPKNTDAAIDRALRADPMVMDLLLCNEKIVLFKVTVGQMPLLDRTTDVNKMQLFWTAIREIFNIKLNQTKFTTPTGRQIITAASGCMILNHHKGSMAARMIAGDSCVADGSVSTVVSAPMSIVEYLKFLFRLLSPLPDERNLPSAIGYLKTPAIEIEPLSEQDVYVDGVKQTTTPIHCEAIPAALKINVGNELEKECLSAEPGLERIDINNLPKGKELVKAQKRKTVPFFSYASEERFHHLFSALREDAQINTLYIVLMVLSTLLAAAGLYLDSASVIIGAMLLAPLMAPILSLAMGVLRSEEVMVKKSLAKIVAGIAIALIASASIALLFPYKPVTGEMQARLNPTVLDLAVAILSGTAAAFSKSHKEIIQSLAGVAIAVALVPPLAVAGTGIGWGDFHFFLQAFLLFFTNLIGIIIAAALTFRVLGFSPAIRGKRSLAAVLCVLAAIMVPLYISYGRIVENRIIEESWEKERFLVNKKYIIVEKADIRRRGDKKIVIMDVVVRDVLNRSDLNKFKKKVKANFSGKLVIHVKTIFIP